MRILMINKYARITGGADKQCMSLAELLRGRGHEVAFLAMASEENIETQGLFVPTSVTHETRDSLTARERAAVFRQALWNGRAADAMKRLVRSFRPDVVHAHRLYPQLSVAPIVVARRHGVPIVQTLHDYEFLSANPFDANGGALDRRDSQIAYRTLNTITFLARRRVHVPAVNAWIAVSDYVGRVHAARHIEATVIPNFADVEQAPPPLPWNRRDGILFLGALSEEKGAYDVLELARALPEARVVIAGRGPLRSRVAVAAAELANLDFRGHLDSAEVTDAIRSARLVVVPSRWEEPGSLVSLEAMAAGTPIVAYRRGGLAEYVTSAGAGLTVEMDPRHLASACQSLLTDAERWREYAAAGIRASESTFSRETHTAAVLAVYERAAGRA
jgi:glycosyltransferase involved in cell wall biosynthesis